MILSEEYRESHKEATATAGLRSTSPLVDYSGKRIAIVNPTTGEILEANFADATWAQHWADWTGAHVRMFRFPGSVSKQPVTTI